MALFFRICVVQSKAAPNPLLSGSAETEGKSVTFQIRPSAHIPEIS